MISQWIIWCRRKYIICGGIKDKGNMFFIIIYTRYFGCIAAEWNILRCPTLTKGSNWQIAQIWESDVFQIGLRIYSTSMPSFELKHSSCSKIFNKSRHNDIALMSMYNDRRILLIYEKCHFQELLPFVKYGIPPFQIGHSTLQYPSCIYQSCQPCATKKRNHNGKKREFPTKKGNL